MKDSLINKFRLDTVRNVLNDETYKKEGFELLPNIPDILAPDEYDMPVIVALDSDYNVLGIATIMLMEDLADILFIEVAESLRRRGIGTELTRYALKLALSHGSTGICFRGVVDENIEFVEKVRERLIDWE